MGASSSAGGRGGNACFQVSSPGKRGFACGACVASDPLLRFPWQPRGAEAGGGEQPGPGPGQGRDCQEAWAGDAALGACVGRSSVAGSCAVPTPAPPRAACSQLQRHVSGLSHGKQPKVFSILRFVCAYHVRPRLSVGTHTALDGTKNSLE